MANEMRRRGMKRLVELAQTALRVAEGESQSAQFSGLLAEWAAGGEEEVARAGFLSTLEIMREFTQLVDRLGKLGDGGE